MVWRQIRRMRLNQAIDDREKGLDQLVKDLGGDADDHDFLRKQQDVANRLRTDAPSVTEDSVLVGRIQHALAGRQQQRPPVRYGFGLSLGGAALAAVIALLVILNNANSKVEPKAPVVVQLDQPTMDNARDVLGMFDADGLKALEGVVTVAAHDPLREEIDALKADGQALASFLLDRLPLARGPK